MLGILNRIRNRDGRALVGNGNHAVRAHALERGVQALRRHRYVWTTAELAPCTCPDFCERDHGND